MSRADPKPGRWILPLVVAGIIAFTYTFVNALPAAEVPSATTSTVVASRTTSTSTTSTSTTTTTTLAPGVATFVDVVDGFSTRTAGLVATAQQLNDDWDARIIEFDDIRSGLSTLRNDTGVFTTALDETEVPNDAAPLWDDVITAADVMKAAADNMFDGLVNTEGSVKRLNSLLDYIAAEVSVQQGLTAAAQAATDG